MDLQVLLLLFALGCLTGFLAGFFGVGGGVILVPVFLYFFSNMLDVSTLVVTHLALGTSLFVVLFASLSSAYQHHRNGNVVPVAVVFIGLTSILAAFAGSFIASSLSGKALQQIFAVVLAVTAGRLIVEQEQRDSGKGINPTPGYMILTGSGAGLIASLTGVGGGVFGVPMMYYFMRFPLKKAVGTSSATIVLTASAGAIGYVVNGYGSPDLDNVAGFTFGFVNYLHAIPVIAGTIPMARLGANLVSRTKSTNLRRFFALFLMIIAARMFFL